MNEPRWLTTTEVEAIHDLQLSLFGGRSGIRDDNMLGSALALPQNRWHDENADLADCAAANAFGIARNRPFVDGNKRAAFMAACTFLGLNGVDFQASNAEVAVMTLALAAGELDEAGYAAWIRDRMESPTFDD